MTREYTNLLIEAVEDEALLANQVLCSILRYMSEDSVKKMCLEMEDREIAWELARFIGYGDNDFSDFPELEEEWKYLQESEDC